ncbi:TIGR03985 family CRISPR-associated protein [Synechococcus sp. W60.1]|uniref:TIGR03985 family CRISPR-associated protein n=1 Tax=Synechococcus sp. W60.1 TaxID=2964516 RepID=UPI0039C49331
MSRFELPLTVEVLRWLAGGQLAERLERAVRLWVLLDCLYGEEGWRDLPETFGYTHIRDRLLSPRHPKQDLAQGIPSPCPDVDCICWKPLRFWLKDPNLLAALKAEVPDLEALLSAQPFHKTHRTLRKELDYLAAQGWLQQIQANSRRRDNFRCRAPGDRPQLPVSSSALTLSGHQLEQIYHILSDVAFVHPDVQVLLDEIWENHQHSQRRLFVWFEYILSDEQQERVDEYQSQLEALWANPEAGVIGFDYATRQHGIRRILTYPVCLFYARRAKYLAAFGQLPTPEGSLGWHNFRLDRIQSERLAVIPWDAPSIPPELATRKRQRKLPSPEEVQAAWEEAWGSDFYLPKALLILRFSPEFARRYVESTVRHPTFQPIAYERIPALVQQAVADVQERQQILNILRQRPASDRYFRAWVRVGDTNFTMRLRDWRPNGEVIAPLAYREQMAREAQAELQFYRPDLKLS